MREISLRSPFRPEECARRLEAATERDHGGFYEDLTRTYAVLARLRGQRVRLRVRHPYTRNMLAPVFYGRFEATPGGTLLRGRFLANPAMLAFVVLWFTGISSILGWAFASKLGSLLAGDTSALQDGHFALSWPPLVIASLAAILWLLWRMSLSDRTDILQLLTHALDASPGGAQQGAARGRRG